MSFEAALGELAQCARFWGAPLEPEGLAALRRYLEELSLFNARTNLTAEQDPSRLVLRHLADGVAAVPLLRRLTARPDPRIADLGSGGGFIGVAIKAAWPQAELTLIESLKRKYEFLNLAALRVGLKGLRVLRATAGKAGLAGGFDAVVARALAPLPDAVALGLPLLRPGGHFVAYQSQPPPRTPELDKALARGSGQFVDLVKYRLPREARERCLAVFRREDTDDADA